MSRREIGSWDSKEKSAYQFHVDQSGEIIRLWNDGFNLIHSNLSRADGTRLSADKRFMAGLIASSIDQLRCIFILATNGYFMQAMNLARMLAEVSVTYWYLYLCPERQEQFDKPKPREPEVKDMIKEIKCHPDAPSELPGLMDWVCDVIKDLELHKYSHISYLTVPSTLMESAGEITSMTFGPRCSNDRCCAVFHDTISLVVMILMCTNHFLMITGHKEIEEYAAYCEKVDRSRHRNDGTV